VARAKKEARGNFEAGGERKTQGGRCQSNGVRDQRKKKAAAKKGGEEKESHSDEKGSEAGVQHTVRGIIRAILKT